MIDKETETTLAEYLLTLADDELILGHRASEWCGYAPILEEDIAFANLALDEIGHAALWYGLVSELTGKDPERHPDHLVYFRQAGEYRNAPLVELPNGDWAFTVLRQYLFDAAELVRLEGLWQSGFAPLAGTAARIRQEELYHLRHAQAWVKRLGQGTGESRRRMQAALDLAWPYTGQLFSITEGEGRLATQGLVPGGSQVRAAWLAQVFTLLQGCDLTVPETLANEFTRGRHTPYLKILLDEMQSVAREEPEASW
jgi:ring-1,2-phenylacetyl-CoA epoxidase subunit PaaC